MRDLSKSPRILRVTKAVLITSFVLLGSLIAAPLAASHNQSHASAIIQAMPASAPFDHIVTILMENQGLCSIYTGCGGSATYMSQFADQNVLVTSWGTTSHPSEGNYISLIGGDNFGHTSDGYCCWGITAPNIIDRIESAGLTWKAFAEDASGSGTCSFNPPRGADHFGFLTFADMNTPTRCANFLSTTSSSDPEFVAAMNTPNPTNYIWLTPNDCNNMHDCSIATGDSYLATLVPKILSSTEFTTTKATLLIVYDEGFTQCASTGGTGECVYASFSGPAAKKSIQLNPTGASHYSYLSTIEAAWGLPSLTSNDASAPNMLGAFGTPCIANCPLATSFTTSASSPLVNVPVIFTTTITGGTAPYTVSWNFGDGTTGIGVIVTHTYTYVQSFTIRETATDSSSPQKSATTSQTVTVASSLTGNFGICNSLPQGWNCGNLHPSAPSPSSAQIVTGVFQSRQSNPGLGGSNDYYYSTTQKGTFPWTPCSVPATGVLPSGITSVNVNFTSLAYNPGSSPSSDRYHIYIALYYWLPGGAVSSGGSTYRCLDTQVRVENIGGTFSSIGSTATYNPGDSFGWDNVTLQISPGQTGILTANVADQCLQDLKAWRLPMNTPCQLAGIEIGTEGYQFQELDVNWYDVSLNVGPIPLSTVFTVSPGNPIVNIPVTFTATTIGGTLPYTISWNFGDGMTGTGAATFHTYTATGSFTVTETVTDSSTSAKIATSSQSITVNTSLPPLLTVPANQTVTAGTWINFTVTATAVNTGGTVTLSATGLPTGANFDQVTGLFYWKPSAGQTGLYTITFIATDSSSPSTPTSKPMGIQVNQAAPGGSNGGNGGSGGSSNGGCTLCIPKVSPTIGLLAIGGLLGLVSALAALTIKARATLERTRRRIRN
jgi:phosphatidylinositol-3-phosphatase